MYWPRLFWQIHVLDLAVSLLPQRWMSVRTTVRRGHPKASSVAVEHEQHDNDMTLIRLYIEKRGCLTCCCLLQYSEGALLRKARACMLSAAVANHLQKTPQAAYHSMRMRCRCSPPGQPPTAPTGSSHLAAAETTVHAAPFTQQASTCWELPSGFVRCLRGPFRTNQGEWRNR